MKLRLRRAGVHRTSPAGVATGGLLLICLAFAGLTPAGVSLGCVSPAAACSTRAATANRLNAVVFLDARNGWTVGNGVILRTTNGGARWKVVTRLKGRLYGVDFVSRTTGWAVGWGVQRTRRGSRMAGLIMKTTNGGRTWTKRWEPLRNRNVHELQDVCFFNKRVGWAVGTDSQLIRTTDGGRSWKGWTDTSGPVSYFAVDFSSASVVWAGGYDSSGVSWGISKLLRSADGGRTYAECPGSRFLAWAVTGLSALHEAAPGVTHVWASSDYGRVLASFDGGHSWSQQAVPGGVYLDDIVVRRSLTGYAVGYLHDPPNQGVVLKTVDGRQWVDVGFRPRQRLTGVCFVDDKRGWAVGTGGAIYRTTDGGTTWKRQ